MYELKRLAIDYDLAQEGAKAAIAAKLFVDIVDKNGRMAEVPLVSRFMLKTNPVAILKMMPRATKLLVRGRMPLFPHRIKGTSELQKCAGTLNESLISGLNPPLTSAGEGRS
jgi:hypothetical protein